ncbi:MAG TPA: LysR family transcriptional regulator [Kofleriaceae bacterium]
MNLSALDLNLLLVLDAVLAERSVARAARRLHVTPPAISNALSRLRATLGDPIVTRSGRGIVPTPRAMQLGPAIACALQTIDEALHGETFDPATASPQLTVAMADAGQIARLANIAALLGSKLPKARLRVVSVDTMVALGGLAGTEVDVAIGVHDPAPQIHRQQIYDEKFSLVIRREHPRFGSSRGRSARASLSQLAEERFVEVHVAFGKPSRLVQKAFTSIGLIRDIAAIVPSFTAAAALVARTDLVGVLPASVADVLGPSLGLAVLPSPVKIPPAPMFMSWHQRTHVDPAMKLFRDVIARAAVT